MMKRLHFVLSSDVVKYILIICAVTYPLVYLIVAGNRISYPFELEWMEGGHVDHVRRVLSGQQLYVEPSLEFVPYIYTPLYFYISAIFAKLLGAGFFPLRLVSSLASVGCFATIFESVRRETESPIFGILSTCLFAATYRISGAWFDIARVDSLFLLFLLCSVFLLRFYHSYGSLFFAGILMSLSFLTKQIALVVAMPLVIYCLLCLPRYSKYIYPLTLSLIIGLSTILLNLVSDGWYCYYVFELPKQHPIVTSALTGFWHHDLFDPLFIALAISLIHFICLVSNRRSRDFIYFFLLFVGMIGASWFSRLHSGGYDNVLFPAYTVISISFGLGVQVLTSDIMVRSPKDSESISSNVRVLLQYFVVLICAIQLLALVYNPLDQLPTREDSNAGHAFVQMLSNIEGEVFVPFHGFLPALAGKRTYAQGMAIKDIWRGKDSEIKGKLRRQIVAAIRSEEFDAIILDMDFWNLQQEIEKEYVLKGRVFDRGDVFWPVTGWRTRPEMLFELAQ